MINPLIKIDITYRVKFIIMYTSVYQVVDEECITDRL